jgi:cytochrome P450
MRTAAGDFTDNVCIPKGTVVVIPFAALNCSVSVWGPDAKTFKPSRWLKEDDATDEARGPLHGYRHLMTFGSGARMCLGRLFALTAFKVSSAQVYRSRFVLIGLYLVSGCAVCLYAKLCV